MPINKNNDENYILSYLKRTDIDTEYRHFLSELLERIDDLKIGNPNARLSTKISSLLFLLVISKKFDITTETISEEFNISISTFKTFYLEIFKNKKLIDDILIKYDIILPDKLPRKQRINKKK